MGMVYGIWYMVYGIWVWYMIYMMVYDGKLFKLPWNWMESNGISWDFNGGLMGSNGIYPDGKLTVCDWKWP